MNNESLFRPEVIKHKSLAQLGTVSINTPFPLKFIAYSITIIILGIILFIFFGECSEKFVVIGCLNDQQGVVSVYPSKSGVITHIYKAKGEQVKQGDAIFLIKSIFDNYPNHRDTILKQLNERKKLIISELDAKEKQFNKLKALLLKKYISLDLYNQKKQEISELQRNINLIEVEIIRHKQEKSYIVYAPVDGFIAAAIFKKGQYVNLTKPLIKIAPIQSELIANLFVPVNQSGFLHKKSKITIRYDAYPYKRFGNYPAVIESIDESILTDAEDEKSIQIGQPYYKVTAKLASQYVNIYGHQKKLQQGMTITAIVEGSKRKIWQWVLDPIFSVYGELTL
ncbi:hemolysin D [Legionella beliardensis]|uniref:Hemolysin D n=1 Tax=Legionella beliardensis TaxID=91822 RepID=A0A378I3D4_9GAMM|nr:HlyD family efflux transporter periplasmic adaptor subunit [Legionella beliardensis]STX29678.1 hemolysin D [Legionella beliardensis]